MNFSLPNGKVKRTIGLAPLIDIVFILLIFFVLESTLTVFNEVRIDFPATTTTSTQTDAGSSLSVQVFSLEKLWVAGRKMNLIQFRMYLSEKNFGSAIPVRLELSEEAPVQAAVFVLDVLNEHGMSNISLGAVRE